MTDHNVNCIFYFRVPSLRCFLFKGTDKSVEVSIGVSFFTSDFRVNFKKRYLQQGGARGVMVIVVGNGHGDTSLNPGRD